MEVKERKKGSANFFVYVVLGIVLLLIACFFSISYGAAAIPLKTAWQAIFSFDETLTEHQTILTLRLPRTIADMIVGASLAVSGAIMQGTTRNPLADSGLMGISSGATFAMALSLALMPQFNYIEMLVISCIGASLTTGLTYFVASTGKKGMTPQRLVLAGISISMLFGAMSSYLSIKYKLGHALMYFTAGGTAGAKWGELAVIFPLFVLGVLASIMLSPSVTMLSLGEEVALGLGLNIKRVKIFSTLIVLVLTGLSVVVIGPVSFVGLIVPHMIRFFVGVDYRFVIPASMLYGALLTVVADIIGRVINRPFETPIGIIFSLIGVPFFLYLVKKGEREF
ncbi:FecCD family ABC transporter permease [Vagococcus carniphilus]|uniref:Ferrichrome ABC transporter permease n=1 Tax=Vagococcus carniphilus TaxID=218144 RepID=A0A430APN7_9ENTE|nr:iron ABC transporter permease [Vagococcus carniphilus]MDT2815173.1 iron ABC transporter permease [Vagococcus carniphilus]MDT2831082.1 iron ABC transporter permease [Vagococcus carniphilus]MDT2833269.1 iron ABC transporter permease [Vagococcus carniphilus]MDT2839759.1 iron ABC transporter permease [Vagococcus carniphilus]MDT2849196.1 iron ABC transporter permease [Vagococcus carniphilus]